MSGTQEPGSEVARVREQLRLEYEAAQQALHGLAQGTAQHAFIAQKMENIAACHVMLKQLVGEQEAIKVLVETFEQPAFYTHPGGDDTQSHASSSKDHLIIEDKKGEGI